MSPPHPTQIPDPNFKGFSFTDSSIPPPLHQSTYQPQQFPPQQTQQQPFCPPAMANTPTQFIPRTTLHTFSSAPDGFIFTESHLERLTPNLHLSNEVIWSHDLLSSLKRPKPERCECTGEDDSCCEDSSCPNVATYRKCVLFDLVYFCTPITISIHVTFTFTLTFTFTNPFYSNPFSPSSHIHPKTKQSKIKPQRNAVDPPALLGKHAAIATLSTRSGSLSL